MKGPCVECGVEVLREVDVDAPMGLHLARLPLVCDECVAKAEREDEAHSAAELERERARRLEARIAASGLPEGLRRLSSDEPGDALESALAWGKGDIDGLLLSGIVGAGKTHLAAIATETRLRRERVFWTSAPLLFARLGSGFGSPERASVIAMLTSDHSLVLDDLDKARPTEFAAEHLFLAIDHRITAGAGLLVTMNLRLSELAGKFPEPYGEALASRLNGYCVHHRLADRDRRERRAA